MYINWVSSVTAQRSCFTIAYISHHQGHDLVNLRSITSPFVPLCDCLEGLRLLNTVDSLPNYRIVSKPVSVISHWSDVQQLFHKLTFRSLFGPFLSSYLLKEKSIYIIFKFCQSESSYLRISLRKTGSATKIRCG